MKSHLYQFVSSYIHMWFKNYGSTKETWVWKKKNEIKEFFVNAMFTSKCYAFPEKLCVKVTSVKVEIC